MKSFVVLSYYQLSHAVAMALDMEERPNLYFSVNHLGIGQDFLDRIRDTGLFHDVVALDHRYVKRALNKDLAEVQDCTDDEIERIGSSLFEKHLSPYYERVFAGADPEDDLYLYNDFQLHYYYIAEHFHRIIGVEDGYGILEKQISLIEQTGIGAFNHGFGKERFVGEYWPEMQWKNPAVKTVYSSTPLTSDAPEYLKAKVKVLDYYELAGRHAEAHRKALEQIFGVEIPQLQSGCPLVLTQPLHRNKYCDGLEDFLFHRKMILEELKHADTVYVKPHPADRNDYSVIDDGRVVVLEKRFPVELLSDRTVRFSRVISLMSSATDSLNAEEKIQLMDNPQADQQYISETIRSYIEGERIRLDAYVIVKECSPAMYVNIYLLCRQYTHVDYRIHVLLRDLPEDAVQYFDIRHAEERIRQYRDMPKTHVLAALWEKHLRKIPKLERDILKNMEFTVEKEWSDAALVRRIIETEGDLSFVVDAHNMGLPVRQDMFHVVLKEDMSSVSAFPGFSGSDGARNELGIGVCGNVIDNRLYGRLYHKTFLKKAIDRVPGAFEGFRILPIGTSSVAKFFRFGFYVPEEDCPLLQEELPALQNLLKDCTSEEELALVIRAMRDWMKVRKEQPYSLKSILQQTRVDRDLLTEGLLCAFDDALEAEQREKARFLYKQEIEFRYCRMEMEWLISRNSSKNRRGNRGVVGRISSRILGPR